MIWDQNSLHPMRKKMKKMTDHKYINILNNSIVDDETGGVILIQTPNQT